MYKGQKVAIKIQRAGLRELFDVDLKNLKKLAVLLDKFDPKSDGADRDWVKREPPPPPSGSLALF